MDKCIYCNSGNIQKKITVGQSAEVGTIGLKYKASLIMNGVEPFHADLCNDCGGVRLYVNNKERKWL